MDGGVSIRPATKEDVPSVLNMIQLLAEYQNQPHAVKIADRDLIRDGFEDCCYFKLLVLELKSPPPSPDTPESPISSQSSPPPASTKSDDNIIGYAMYFYNYSTWEGPVMYLEDLFVRKEYRGKGYDTALIKWVAQIGGDTGCCRMMLQVLDTNTAARKLYERLGGEILSWLLVRLYKPQLINFGDQLMVNDTVLADGSKVIYRHATRDDVAALLGLIKDLAAAVKKPDGVKIGTEKLLHDGFGEECYFKVLLAELVPLSNGTSSSSSAPSCGNLIGYALYYFTYSPYEGRVINLEDIYVKADFRDNGCGTALMKEVAKVGNARDCNQMIWLVEDWNTRAINLYKKIGGHFVKELLTVKFPNLHDLAS